jgi:hypothetical protein
MASVNDRNYLRRTIGGRVPQFIILCGICSNEIKDGQDCTACETTPSQPSSQQSPQLQPQSDGIFIEDANVLNICKIPSDIDIKKIKFLVANYMKPRKLFYTDTDRVFFIEPEFSEWWITKASDGQTIGKGHGAMDVKTNTGNGIDATCIVMNGKISNEKSLMQNFKDAGANLDSFFTTKNDIDAVAMFRNNYKDKLLTVKHTYKLNGLYIFAFISTRSAIYVSCFEINLDNIKGICSGGFIDNTKDCVNIIVKGFISPEYGNVKLYKSKKRMELRFNSAVLNDPNTIEIYRER